MRTILNHFRIKKILITIFLTWIACHSNGQASADIPNSEARYPLEDYSALLEDPSSTMELSDVLRQVDKFKDLDGRQPSFGFSKSAYWFSFSIPPQLHNSDYLVVFSSYTLIDKFELYTQDPTGTFNKSMTGREVLIADHADQNRHSAFVIDLKKIDIHAKHYIRAKSSGSSQFPLFLMSWKSFYKIDHQQQLVIGLYSGAMLIMALYNLIIFLVDRKLRYGIYVCWIATNWLLTISTASVPYEYFWPNSPQFNKLTIAFLACFTMFLCCAFYLSALDCLAQSKKLKLITQTLCVLALCSALLTLALPYRFGIFVGVGVIGGGASYLAGICIYFTIKRNRTAYFFLLSFVQLTAFTLIYLFKSFSILPTNLFTEYSSWIGTLTQVVMLTFALADQYRQIQKENEKSKLRMIEIQEENIRSLDLKVEEKTRDLRNIFATIKQGIFTISGPKIHIDGDYSEHLKSIMQCSNPSEMNPFDLLTKDSDLTNEQKSQLESVIENSIYEDELNFSVNANLMPSSIRKTLNGNDQFLQIDWLPILNGNGVITKFLVTVRDVTSLKALEARSQKQSKELLVIQELIAVPEQKLNRFFEAAKRYLSPLLEAIQQNLEPNLTRQILIVLHTLKGDARNLGLSTISTHIHDMEDQIKQITAESRPEAKVSVQFLLDSLQELIIYFKQVNSEKLGRQDTGRVVRVDHLMQLSESLSKISDAPLDTESRYWYSKSIQQIYQFCYESLSEVIDDLRQPARSIAKQLGKENPSVIFTSEDDIYFESAVRDALAGVFVHLLRNSLDHGIEDPETRVSQGKPRAGNLQVHVAKQSQYYVITYEDDGRGLNLKTIWNKALDRGLVKSDREYKDLEIAALIFEAGFSTAHQVSEISGRGVGMDAAKSMIEGIGGEFKIEIKAYKTQEQVAIRFIISIPELSAFTAFKVATDHQIAAA